jgi:GAF domain-containing protein
VAFFCPRVGMATAWNSGRPIVLLIPMLDQMNQRLKACTSFEGAITRILMDVVALHGAEFGNIQLPVGDSLLLVDEVRLEASFLLAFREVRNTDGCACGRAWQAGEAIIIPDVESDDAYEPFREIAREAGYRSVQSTPLVTSDRICLGMVSTLFAAIHTPTSIEMSAVDMYARTAANYLQTLAATDKREEEALRLHAKLYSSLDVAAVGTAGPAAQHL